MRIYALFSFEQCRMVTITYNILLFARSWLREESGKETLFHSLEFKGFAHYKYMDIMPAAIANQPDCRRRVPVELAELLPLLLEPEEAATS